MENKVFIVLVLFGLVTMGLAAPEEEEDVSEHADYGSNGPDDHGPNNSGGYGDKGYEDKHPKQGYGKPNVQVYHYVSKSENHHSNNDDFDFDIKSLLSKLHHQDDEYHKKDDKSSEYPIPKDIQKQVKAALKKKFAKFIRHERSIKHTKEHQRTREHSKEKVKQSGGDEGISAQSIL